LSIFPGEVARLARSWVSRWAGYLGRSGDKNEVAVSQRQRAEVATSPKQAVK
jgi:hypothetical protein